MRAVEGVVIPTKPSLPLTSTHPCMRVSALPELVMFKNNHNLFTAVEKQVVGRVKGVKQKGKQFPFPRRYPERGRGGAAATWAWLEEQKRTKKDTLA